MRYILYFLYLGWHWGIAMACFVIWHEVHGEKKYGIRTIGTDDLSTDVSEEDREHATMYEPVNYYTATWLFDHLQPADLQTSLLDVGCGKGRILAVGAAYGFRNMTGIDFSPGLCRDATALAGMIKNKYPDTSITIACEDARYYDIPETTGVIFLFNPFNEVIMETFIRKVNESLLRKQRPLKVLYANPQCKDQWLAAGFKETASFVKLRYLKGSVLEKE
ncbi:methyltransferase domain-containing protein [Chitinophaga tropicalis]|uniref:Methyltransferase domain-containing protein n=1 Tax=Chitinophaga tropicalis TaxID=2683588 RepID=A0A7K1UDD1_9BACT|nr:class I SAM-dependent methyltransferase [Chitinophaga tropicalis]MVT12382.1 methyltransferase domain-containing protein [Chitinophaga tropicalis]